MIPLWLALALFVGFFLAGVAITVALIRMVVRRAVGRHLGW